MLYADKPTTCKSQAVCRQKSMQVYAKQQCNNYRMLLETASMLGLTKLLQFRQHQWWEFRQYAFSRMGSQKISACQHMLPGAAVGRAQPGLGFGGLLGAQYAGRSWCIQQNAFSPGKFLGHSCLVGKFCSAHHCSGLVWCIKNICTVMKIVADVLTLLQGINIPKLLGQGQIHDGMHAFIATSAGGSALTVNMLQDHPEMKQNAMLSLDALHWHGTLHGDVALHNFMMSDDGQAVWLVDFSDSCQGSVSELF